MNLLRAFRAAIRFIPTRWWTYPPYLPIPPRRYVEWRCEVMYGDKNKKPSLRELYRFLVWADKYYTRT